MNRILIITEGQTEQILIQNTLLHLFDLSKISINSFKFLSDRWGNANLKHNSPNSIISFEIRNVQNDDNVLNYIKKFEVTLFNQGFKKIIGLRDMYSHQYKRKSNVVNKKLNIEYMKNTNDLISKMKNASKIKIFFAIMEIESWFLAMYSIFKKFNCKLTSDFIYNNSKIDLKKLEPEEIFRPSKYVDDIFKLVGKEYDKSLSCVEALTKNIDYKDYTLGIEKKRCINLENFYNELLNFNIPLIKN